MDGRGPWAEATAESTSHWPGCRAGRTGGEGGDLGGDLGDDLGGDDLGGDDLGGDDAAEGDDDALLAEPEPGQRDDYMRVKSPKWRQGARRRSYLSAGGSNLASSSQRNLFKGWSDGMGPLSRGTVGEAKQSEEEIIFETQNHIKRLIEQLGQKDESQA